METIIDKLKKVLALTESDQKFEAEAATYQLKKLMEKYGLTLNDIVDETEKEFVYEYKNEDEVRIICQLVAMVTNRRQMSYSQQKSKKRLFFQLKKNEGLELNSLVHHYIGSFRKEKRRILATMATAFVNKHDLFPTDTDDNEPSSGSSMTIEELELLMTLMNAMSESHYRKSITA